jgi:RNA binding exosome subunit
MDVASLAFRAFAHATEDPQKVEKALKFVSGAEEIAKTTSTGYHGNPIVIMEAKVTEGKALKAFFRSLAKEDLKTLLETIERRVDEESFFFLRLDKQEAFLGNFRMAEGEDVIAVRGKIKSYPQNRENALAAMKKFLEGEIERAGRADEKD